MKRLRNFGKVGNEPSVVRRHAEKSPNIMDIPRSRELLYSICEPGIGLETGCRDDVAQVVHSSSREFTLRWLQLEVRVLQALYHFSQVLEVLVESRRKDEYIVDIRGHEVIAIFRVKSGQNLSYQPLTAGAFVRPNGITLNSYNPCGVAKAVFSWELGSILIGQNPDARSSVEKYFALPS